MPGSLFDRPNVDLRRRSVREHAEFIVDRARWLMPEDRAVLEAIYREGLSAAQVAELRGEPARAIRRRVRHAVAKVLSPQFTFVLRHRERWPAMRRRIATACVLQGRAMRDGARHLKLSLHAVRTELGIVNALFENESATSRRAG